MPVEFALRPRIRLREAPAPARRARARLPKFALPALAYWLVIGGLVYEFVRHHTSSVPPGEAEAALAPLVPAPPPTIREWWRPLPAPIAPPPTLPPSEPTPAEPEGAVAALTENPPAEPAREAPAEPAPDEAAFRPDAPLATTPAVRPAPRFRSESRPTRTLDRVDEPAASLPSISEPALALAPLTTPTPEAARAPLSAPAPAESGGLPSCEAALAAASQDVDFSGGNRAADLPTQAIAAVLENGAWLSSCAVPEHTTLDVCVAIKGGHVVGASVTSRPSNAALSGCVKRRASSLQFPYSPHLDLARTRF